MAEKQILDTSKYPEVPDYDQDVNFENIDSAIATYIATRDDLDKERKSYNQYEARAKNYMARIEMFVKDKADELGMDSVRTPSGTAFRSVKISYRVGNWDEYWAWIKEHDYSQCVERRAAKNAVKEIHDETGEIPPGLEYYVEVGFDFRRPSK
jgi:hypothetical protein